MRRTLTSTRSVRTRTVSSPSKVPERALFTAERTASFFSSCSAEEVRLGPAAAGPSSASCPPQAVSSRAQRSRGISSFLMVEYSFLIRPTGRQNSKNV